MAHIINLTTFTDTRGNLTVVENVLPFDIKRVFYIYGVDNSMRGGHAHKKTIHAAICLTGSALFLCDNGKTYEHYLLDVPNKCLLINPEDWHQMFSITKDCILMVFASENFDKDDYIYEKPKETK